MPDIWATVPTAERLSVEDLNPAIMIVEVDWLRLDKMEGLRRNVLGSLLRRWVLSSTDKIEKGQGP
jgi:hypothetical protein